MKKMLFALMSTAAIATCYTGAFADAAAPTLGYVQGSLQTSCSGEPLQAGRCSPAARHVRCWQTVNPLPQKVKCNVAMKANMYNSEEGFTRAYTVGLATEIFATDKDWLCFNYDNLLEGGPVAWTLETIDDPVVSCATGGAQPPCSREQLKQDLQSGSASGQCPSKQQVAGWP